jgi:hypothetical protein
VRKCLHSPENDASGKATISLSLEQNSAHFNQARDKLEKWADDMVLSAEKALTDTKEQIKVLRRQARQAVTLEEQHSIQEKIQKLEADKAMFREPKPGFSEVMELVAALDADYPPLNDVSKALQELFEKHKAEYRAEIEANGQEWDADAKRQDPWRGCTLTAGRNTEMLTDLCSRRRGRQRKARLWVWE